jgi:hypothetical protein
MNLFGFGKKKVAEETDDGLVPDPKPRRPLTITFDRPQSVAPLARGSGIYELTGQGKIQLKTLDESDPNYMILAAIEENGNLSIGQIAERAHLSTQLVEKYICGRHGLMADGLVRKVGGGG